MKQENKPSLLIELAFNAPLSKEIQIEYNKLANLIACLPKLLLKAKKIEGTKGLISVADMISYQIGWGNLLLGWYEAGVKGKSPEMPGDGFSKWNYREIAKHFYQKYHFDGELEQHKMLHQTILRILHIIEMEYQTGNLDKIGVWPWCTLPSGKKWPLSKWVTVNTKSPYKKAIRQIRSLLKEQNIEVKRIYLSR